ncbi:DMT family transporter [Minwuia sp.]|uniref:DMT family transporter n=1 Tax=Minwuia sp. TaxID=2493630 RepID=UPI003A90D002
MRPGWIEYVLLGLLATFWGASYPLLKIALETIPPVSLVAFRVSVAVIFLVIVMQATGQKFPRDRETWRKLAIQSCLNGFGAWTLLAWGQQFVEASLATVLNSTAPIFVVLAGLLPFRRQAVGARAAFGALLGLGGVILIVGTDALAGLGEAVIAQLAILAGAMLYGMAAIYGRNFSHLGPATTAAGSMLWSSAILLPASVLIDQPWTLDISLRSLVAASALAFFSTALAFLLYFRLVRTLGSLGVTSQAYLRIGVGVGLGVIFLGDVITPVMGTGILAAFMGVLLINWPVRDLR